MPTMLEPESIEVSSQAESIVHRPGSWLVLLVGAVFCVLGAGFFFTAGDQAPPGIERWIVSALCGTFMVAGGGLLIWVLVAHLSKVHVRHAADDALRRVPREPVLAEGSIVHGRLTHELVEVADGWQLRPCAKLWRNDKRFLLGFGIPFLIFGAGCMSFAFHNEPKIGSWPNAILVGTFLTAACGGTAFLLIAMLMRASYRRLGCVSITRGGDLELDVPEEPDPKKTDLGSGMHWAFVGDARRYRLTISRDRLVAVQLCPWNYAVGNVRTWGVQGLLVLEPTADGVYPRQPLLLTSDFVGAARLMERLAAVIEVPYLFGANAEGWQAEALRAKHRRPLRIGGTQS